jgi:hypothetical protein
MTAQYEVREDFDDDGGPDELIPLADEEAWKMNALLGLLTHMNGGKLELDLGKLREIVGRPLAVHFDVDAGSAVLELLPEEPKAATHGAGSRRN